MKSFDDLFNEFFNRKKNVNPLHDELKKIIESLTNFKPSSLDNEDAIAQQLGIDLNEPTRTEEFIEDGMRFTKLIWETPRGKFVKIVVTDINDMDNIPFKNVERANRPEKTKSLEEQLQEAVDNEDYETAIKLRDKINALAEILDEPKKRRKKTS